MNNELSMDFLEKEKGVVKGFLANLGLLTSKKVHDRV